MRLAVRRALDTLWWLLCDHDVHILCRTIVAGERALHTPRL
jgi:hypothetical protein